VIGDWYIAVDGNNVKLFNNIGLQTLSTTTPATDKKIVIKSAEGMLYAYDGEKLFMKESVSVGLKDSPTPKGVFKVFIKTPSRYMQGPIQDITDQKYDLPGVPWNLYFTKQGAVIHGAYWHDHFGQPWSHGCVNLLPERAKELYLWADVGTAVFVMP
jgi:lipoprotein-anchoring transpeptidase ErfK/SrfK